MKKRYQYIEPDKFGNTVTVTMNEDQIIYTYWKFWKSKMEYKYGKGHVLITRENCIKDWVTIYWASEININLKQEKETGRLRETNKK